MPIMKWLLQIMKYYKQIIEIIGQTTIKQNIKT